MRILAAGLIAFAGSLATACSSGTETCPTNGDPYQQTCSNEGETCQGTTSCTITPVQTFVCQNGAWSYPHGSPTNCGDVASEGGAEQCPSLSLSTGMTCHTSGLVCVRSTFESGCASNNNCTCDGATFSCPPTCLDAGGGD